MKIQPKPIPPTDDPWYIKFEHWLNKVTVCAIKGHRFWRWNNSRDIKPSIWYEEDIVEDTYCSQCYYNRMIAEYDRQIKELENLCSQKTPQKY